MTNIRELLRELARPRMTGSAGAHEVAAIVRARLNAVGYQVRDFPFAFSALPGRFAVSLCGVLFLAGTLAAAALLNLRHPGVAFVVLLTLLLIAGGVAVLAAPMSQVLPLGRITGTNLLAFRPNSRPRYLIMAHLDSKSQPLPLAFRGPAIALALISWAAFATLALLGMLDAVWIMPSASNALAVACLVAGVLLVLCWTENRSPGALDNASGLAALIGIAERADYDDVAFLVTDAEEFGMVGARAIARQLDPVIGIINIDGIDDDGPYYVMERFGIPRRHIAPHLAAALLNAADEMAVPMRRRDVPFGIYLDHIPMAQAHLPAISLMRGSIVRSLGRVHRPQDSMDRMTGAGVEHAIELVTRAIDVLHRQPIGVSL